MGRGFTRLVSDISPMPSLLLAGTKTIKFGATYNGRYTNVAAFPVVAPPTASRSEAQGVVDTPGIISLSHNATNATAPGFVLCAWSEMLQYWIVYEPKFCVSQGQVEWKVEPHTPFYIYSTVALTGASSVVAVGGVTLQGNDILPTAGV